MYIFSPINMSFSAGKYVSDCPFPLLLMMEENRPEENLPDPEENLPEENCPEEKLPDPEENLPDTEENLPEEKLPEENLLQERCGGGTT